MEWNNHPVVEEILRLRHRSATLLGFRNFAALSLARKMAESEEQVLEFLEDLARRSRRFAQQEFARLEQFAGRKLEGWDVSYYAEKLQGPGLAAVFVHDEIRSGPFPEPGVFPVAAARLSAGLLGADAGFDERLEARPELLPGFAAAWAGGAR